MQFNFSLLLLSTTILVDVVSVIHCKLIQKDANDLNFRSSTNGSGRSVEMGRLSALVAVDNGTEDIEAVTCIDVLRRAGIDVVVASAAASSGDGSVVFANKLRVVPDAKIADLKGNEFDVIVLPGGMPGAEHLRDSAELTEMLKKQKNENRLIAAICASPKVVLEHHNILGDLPSTGYPSFQTKNYKRQSVVESENIITSRGPGTAMEFAMAIVERLLAKTKRSELESQMLVVEA